jgi:methionine synthase I (cobalamin-dependent)
MSSIHEAIKKNILILDGAMGTMLQRTISPKKILEENVSKIFHIR